VLSVTQRDALWQAIVRAAVITAQPVDVVERFEPQQHLQSCDVTLGPRINEMLSLPLSPVSRFS
jgi:hypothetical protein